MNDSCGRKIVEGIYKRTVGEPIKETYDFSPNKIELYFISKKEEKLIATNIEGNSYVVKDPGFYDRTRNSVHKGEIDCFDLFKIESEDREALKANLLTSKNRASKLLQMLETSRKEEGPKN